MTDNNNNTICEGLLNKRGMYNFCKLDGLRILLFVMKFILQITRL